MRRRRWVFVAVSTLVSATAGVLAYGTLGHSSARTDQSVRAQIAERYGALPIAFEPNRGNFLAHGSGYSLSATSRGAVLALPKVAVRLQLVGGTTARTVGVDRLPGTVNYLTGNDPSHWRTGIPTYAGVQQRNVYPGIDLAYHGKQGRLEYDFLLAPGADPSAIGVRFAGAKRTILDRGELVLSLPGGVLRQPKPIAYQQVGGKRKPVDVGYVLQGPNRVGLRVAAYDRARPLVIDPALVYSTFIGGSNSESGWGIAVDGGGNAYVAGTTRESTDLPTTPGAFDTSADGFYDAFITKLNATGTALVYSTYLGGSGNDNGFALALDAADNAYVTGDTNSTDFPTTPGAFETSPNGNRDAFVTKLNATGSALVYSTYLGGDGDDEGRGITVDAAGSAYVTGDGGGAAFPTTLGAFDTTPDSNDGFVTKLDPAGSTLVYSTFLGGSESDGGSGIAVDATGSAYVIGSTQSADFPTTVGAHDTSLGGGTDEFVTKFDPTGSSLAYSTYLGGSGEDDGRGIAVDGTGNAHVIGLSLSTDYPTTAGAFDTTPNGDFDAVVSDLNATGSALLYSTYLGGSAGDDGNAIALDATGNAYLTGRTMSADFPTTAGAYDTTLGGDADVWVGKLDPTGATLAYSTYLGSTGYEDGRGIAADAANAAYVTGEADDTTFPTTAGAFDTTNNGGDAFVSKLDTTAQPTPPLDHFGCSEAKGNEKFQQAVTLTDQFGTTTGVVRHPRLFCNAVSKNGEPVSQPQAHLKCYDLAKSDPRRVRRSVEVTNQFGTVTLGVDKVDSLCAPASAGPAGSDPGPPTAVLDHFECYTLKDARELKITVTLDGQPARVKAPRLLCNPVSKNGEPIVNPDGHLLCYDVDARPHPEADVAVRDQFQLEQLRVKNLQLLCVPSTKREL
jgi:hypothetical protein